MLRSISPDKLNSMTKYPSIPTYHNLNNDGSLTEPVVEFVGPVVGTEKINGLNARIIFLPDGSYVLGSREELLYASGDYLANPVHGLVQTLSPLAQTRWDSVAQHSSRTDIVVFYGELYGGRNLTPASKDYTSTHQVGFRLFDVSVTPNHAEIANWEIEKIALWRDSGGQNYLPEHCLKEFAADTGIELTPRLLTLDDASQLPRTVEDTHIWLTEHGATTHAGLDEGARGRSEGIVLRSVDRSAIAKLRFQNYDRTRQLREKAAAKAR